MRFQHPVAKCSIRPMLQSLVEPPFVQVVARIHSGKYPLRNLIPSLLACLIRALAFTLRFKVLDRTGMTKGNIQRPVIWVFWHNRILMLPSAFKRFCPGRTASVLTSASKDGSLLVGVMSSFGVGCVRGSSSRGGGSAMLKLNRLLKSGEDVIITPDGPRGPVYKMTAGVIKLAQLTQVPVLPVHVRYSHFWQLRSWDAFQIPKPFSRVEIILGELHDVRDEVPGIASDAECSRLESVLNFGV